MRACCQKQENRADPVRLSESLVVAMCRVCGAKHYEMEVEPGKILGDGAEV